jgi:hypothetical protein
MQAKPNGFCGKKTAHDRTPTSAAPMNGYPRVFNIEADPREKHNIGEMYEWVAGPLLRLLISSKCRPAATSG